LIDAVSSSTSHFLQCLEIIVYTGGAIAAIWGGIKAIRSFVDYVGANKSDKIQSGKNMKELKDGVDKLSTDVDEIKIEIMPNGKNTQRLGDAMARSEDKIDALIASGTERDKKAAATDKKVDEVIAKLERHLGQHEGFAATTALRRESS
jgi:hypothetical protein